jgi:hypothetical protein
MRFTLGRSSELVENSTGVAGLRSERGRCESKALSDYKPPRPRTGHS